MDTSEVSEGLVPRWSVNLGNVRIAWGWDQGRTDVVFLPFSCSQSPKLARRHGVHGDLKPVHCTCFVKVLALFVYLNSIHLFLSEGFCGQGHWYGSQENGVFSPCVIYCVLLSGVLHPPCWLPYVKNGEN